MPLTLPTHPLAVVPLKLRWPRRFDGLALVIGATAPDLAYALEAHGPTVHKLEIHSHAWHSALWWAWPVTVVVVTLVRWAAPIVAVHLPEGGDLALRDYGVLGSVRHRWYVTAVSAMLGAASHIGWDALTHPHSDGHVPFPALRQAALPGVPWWDALSTVSDLIGFVVAPVLIVHIGRRRLLRRWHGAPPAAPRRPGTFWPAGLAVLGAGLALMVAFPVRWLPEQAIRTLLVVGVALVVGALMVRLSRPGTSSRTAGGPGRARPR